MGATDFSQWNPNAVNQEDDSSYQSDTQRSGGAPTGAIFPSLIANKILYQLSTFVRAFALMLVGKGYSPVDGSSPFTPDTSSNPATSALAAVLANIQTAADGYLTKFTEGTPSSTSANGQQLWGFNIPASALRFASAMRIVISLTATGGAGVNVNLGGTQVDEFEFADTGVPSAQVANYDFVVNAVSSGSYTLLGTSIAHSYAGNTIIDCVMPSTVVTESGGNLFFQITQFGSGTLTGNFVSVVIWT